MSQPYYSDDLVTLYLGDCLTVTEWLDADVLVTDPPYGMGYRADGLHCERSLRTSTSESVRGDNNTQVRDAAVSAWGDRPAVVFGTWRHPLSKPPTHRLIWHKAGRHPGISPHPWFPVDEEIYLIGSGWVGTPTPTVLTTTEQRSMEPSRIGHPTPKPIGLMARLIKKCPPGVIADPFAGSGSTLVAAAYEGRRAVGVEVEERYCELIANRLSQDILDFGEV